MLSSCVCFVRALNTQVEGITAENRMYACEQGVKYGGFYRLTRRCYVYRETVCLTVDKSKLSDKKTFCYILEDCPK
jgi:hypothetical protein